jgi:protein-disulfide isomerase
MLIALSQISVHRPDSSAPSGGGPGKPASSLLAGIPQHGNELGPPNAPVVLVEYSDFQCPFCARFAADVLPVIVRDYVRTGTVKLVYRGLAFLGPGSVTALATATAAGSENRMWNVAELLYRYQGPENAWVTDDLLRSITTEAGADADRVFAERDSKTVSATMVRWAHQATADGVQGTPTFLVGRRGEPLEPLALQMMSLSEFRAALDQALGR